MAGQERRSFPRVKDEGMTLKLNTVNFDTTTHSLNISASGLYCKVSREIPLMSRVKLALMLPEQRGERAVQKNLEIDGVVVREHPVIIDGEVKHYDVAIFFDNLSERNRESILNYITNIKKD